MLARLSARVRSASLLRIHFHVECLSGLGFYYSRFEVGSARNYLEKGVGRKRERKCVWVLEYCSRRSVLQFRSGD